MILGFEVTSAKSKRAQSADEQPVVQPMRPEARGEQRRAPSTDQRRVRSQMRRKMAAERHEDWGTYQHGDTGEIIHMIRGNHNQTHFVSDTGEQVGPIHANIAPAAAWALSNGYFSPDLAERGIFSDRRSSRAPIEDTMIFEAAGFDPQPDTSADNDGPHLRMVEPDHKCPTCGRADGFHHLGCPESPMLANPDRTMVAVNTNADGAARYQNTPNPAKPAWINDEYTDRSTVGTPSQMDGGTAQSDGNPMPTWQERDGGEALERMEERQEAQIEEGEGYLSDAWENGDKDGRHISTKKGASMTTEADLLNALADPKVSYADRQVLASKLEEMRAGRLQQVAAQRETDLTADLVFAHLSAVPSQVEATTESDWLSEIPSEGADPTGLDLDMAAEGALWFEARDPAVVEDAEEFDIQAQGMARRLAGRYGESAEVAARRFMDTVARLRTKAITTDTLNASGKPDPGYEVPPEMKEPIYPDIITGPPADNEPLDEPVFPATGPGAHHPKINSSRTAVSLKDIRLAPGSSLSAQGEALFQGTDPQGNAVTFKASAQDAAQLKSAMTGDLGQNFSGVDVDDADIVHTGSLQNTVAEGEQSVCGTCGRPIQQMDYAWYHLRQPGDPAVEPAGGHNPHPSPHVPDTFVHGSLSDIGNALIQAQVRVGKQLPVQARPFVAGLAVVGGLDDTVGGITGRRLAEQVLAHAEGWGGREGEALLRRLADMYNGTPINTGPGVCPTCGGARAIMPGVPCPTCRGTGRMLTGAKEADYAGPAPDTANGLPGGGDGSCMSCGGNGISSGGVCPTCQGTGSASNAADGPVPSGSPSAAPSPLPPGMASRTAAADWSTVTVTAESLDAAKAEVQKDHPGATIGQQRKVGDGKVEVKYLDKTAAGVPPQFLKKDKDDDESSKPDSSQPSDTKADDGTKDDDDDPDCKRPTCKHAESDHADDKGACTKCSCPAFLAQAPSSDGSEGSGDDSSGGTSSTEASLLGSPVTAAFRNRVQASLARANG